MTKSLLITGSSGMVAKCLLANLPVQIRRVYCQSRQPRDSEIRGGTTIEWIQADLRDTAAYEACLSDVDTVIHLAAATGKAHSSEFDAVNCLATRGLLNSCRRYQVGSFVFVSSIAARFPDAPHQHYARSKREAEEIVKSSGVPFAIVRPTIVVGPGSGSLGGLVRLASLPWIVVFGGGHVQVQPIYVNDLVRCLLEVIDDRWRGETLELGGPEIVCMDDLLQRIRRVRGIRDSRLVHLPLVGITKALVLAERLRFPLLPFTAGQLASFAHDGIAAPNELTGQLASEMKIVDEMLRLSLV